MWARLHVAAQPLRGLRCFLANEQPDGGFARQRKPDPDSADRLCGAGGTPEEGRSEFEIRVRLPLREGADESREIRDTTFA